MSAIGFCGGSHCRPGRAERLKARGAALVIADMGELATAMAELAHSSTGCGNQRLPTAAILRDASLLRMKVFTLKDLPRPEEAQRDSKGTRIGKSSFATPC